MSESPKPKGQVEDVWDFEGTCRHHAGAAGVCISTDARAPASHTLEFVVAIDRSR